MNRMIAAAIGAALMMLSASSAAAQQSDAEDIWTRLINRETTTRWIVAPERPAPRVVESPGVPGESALRVRVSGRGANPWDVQATSPIGGDIAEGDVVLLMFYARAEQPAEGGSQLPVRLQLSGAPYTSLMDGVKQIDGEWRQHCLWTVAGQAFRGDLTNVSLHLATGRQVVDLGPVFVFNLGAGYDQARLPNCG